MITRRQKILSYILVICLGFFFLNFDFLIKKFEYYLNLSVPDQWQDKITHNLNGLDLKPNELFIPELNILAPIRFVTAVNEKEFQRSLQNGIVQYPGTAPVGEVGNTYIFGHSSDFAFAKGSFKTIFALLPNIQIGSSIFVSNHNTAIFEYVVINKFVADKKDTHLLQQDTNGKKILTLQTSYPIGTALKRYIIQAEMK